jgi:hypothetical protein
MQLTKQHLSNMRTHVLQQQEQATLDLGRAFGKIELLKELESLLEMDEPEEEAPEFVLKKVKPPE